VLDEMSLIIVELFPVLQVLGKIDLFSGPESGLLILVHLPYIVVFDGQNNESMRVLFKKGLRKRSLCLGVAAILGLHDILASMYLRICTELTEMLLLLEML
jgi:hypothetical protein